MMWYMSIRNVVEGSFRTNLRSISLSNNYKNQFVAQFDG